MKIVLQSISQNVDLANPLGPASNFLVLNVETAKGVSEVRVPISQETVQELVKAIHVIGGSTGEPQEQEEQEEVPQEAIPDDLEGATEFGGGEDDEDPEMEQEEDQDEGPVSEERVKSL
jgi:hypothetical protein